MKRGAEERRARLEAVLERWFSADDPWREAEEPLRPLVELVDALRSERRSATLAPFLAMLRADGARATRLGTYVGTVLRGRRVRHSFTDHGIIADTSFWREVRRRLGRKLLPEQPPDDTMAQVLTQVFYQQGDGRWVRALPQEELVDLFRLLALEPVAMDRSPTSRFADLLFAANVLAHRMGGRALEAPVQRMVPEEQGLQNPFLVFQRRLDDLVDRFLAGEPLRLEPGQPEHDELLALHRACRGYVDRAFANSAEHGITIRVNQNLLRIRQQLDRVGVLLELMALGHARGAERTTIELARHLIGFHGAKNNVRALVEESTRLTAFEITQHTARTGEHYITTDRAEYRRMFLSAAGGGVIVAVMCIVKTWLGQLHPTLFGKAFLYSLNYAAGFILIYLTGATLATKQPAMTAATLASSLRDTVGRSERYGDFAILFARLFRSQFIAFMGNVLLAFPVALGLSMGLAALTGAPIAAAQWPAMVQDLSPVASLAVLHAAIAGVYLFLSGLIAGSVANSARHERVPERIRRHPWIIATLGARAAARLAAFHERHWAGIVSNAWFGVFMGSTVVVGIIIGLPLDIRHITFAAGNLGIALHAAGFQLPVDALVWSIVGIGVIGFVNFLVSFTLSLGVAMRSRGIPLGQVDDIARAVLRHFRRKPWQFFFPPRGTSHQVGPSSSP